ncbi:MAG TPA: 50S ribosomal protein L5 [candidate division WWE3 bacterium]|uniref:Large ribosomal subunit protein uL5 n=1 Tax=candidate division WWE3 bacterium TaxID=2053526 RepID=A0A7V5MH57_UNCKA|nr:50S ribosomal protein L5 [candidate division WWE3 bacterium]
METLYKEYKNRIKKELMKELGLSSAYQVPDLVKVTLNMGVGSYKDNKEYLKEAEEDLTLIAGQKALPRPSKKAVSGFKLRQGEIIGFSVTLRGEKAWSFIEKLTKIVLPRVRDFKGVSTTSFDGAGNYSLGIEEHFVFPEVNAEKVKYLKGLQINIVTSTKSDKEAKLFLEKIGMPFKKKVKK